MARQEDRPYHVLIRWPEADESGHEPIGRLLADSGGVVVVPGLDRLVGFATAADRDAALRRAERAFGEGCVLALGLGAAARRGPTTPGLGPATPVRG